MKYTILFTILIVLIFGCNAPDEENDNSGLQQTEVEVVEEAQNVPVVKCAPIVIDPGIIWEDENAIPVKNGTKKNGDVAYPSKGTDEDLEDIAAEIVTTPEPGKLAYSVPETMEYLDIHNVVLIVQPKQPMTDITEDLKVFLGEDYVATISEGDLTVTTKMMAILTAKNPEAFKITLVSPLF